MESRHRFHPVILQRSREMRHPQTAAEATLWQHLRNRNMDFKFRRQHPIERFIVDFYCPAAKLSIEIDGASHLEPQQHEYDLARTQFLETLGCTVIRFSNEEVHFDVITVLESIVATCKKLDKDNLKI